MREDDREETGRIEFADFAEISIYFTKYVNIN